jgi:hypothetical protein
MQKVEKHYSFANKPISTNNAISLIDFLTPLYRSRWLILIVTLLVAAVGIAGSLLTAKYASEGFFQFGGAVPTTSFMDKKRESSKDRNREKERDRDGGREREKETEPNPGISLANYKRYAASFATPERFFDYVKEKNLEATPAVNSLRNAFSSSAGISKIIEPVYPFTKLDAKILVDQPKGSSNNVIGLRIAYASSTAEEAQQMVDLLGRYAMDSIIYLIYSDDLRFKQSEINAKMAELDNEIITLKERMAEYGRKGADLRQIVSNYPQSANQTARQVVSVSEDSARYLSPVTQLVTTEVQASDANKAIRKARREQLQGALLLEYYDKAKALLESTKSGETVLRGLATVKENVFKGKNMSDEVVQEVYNTITVDNQNAINVYLEKSRFIAGPTLPTRSSARLTLVLAASLMVGLFLSVVLVFGKHWWIKNHPSTSG